MDATADLQLRPLRVLRVDASGRRQDSITRQLLDTLLERLAARHRALAVTVRDVSTGLPTVDSAWIAANFTAPETRSAEQQASLAQSDALVAELMNAEVLVIGVPVYNFGVPAALKAWVDLVARAGVTFRYTDEGPMGLLGGRKAYLVLASGGVPLGSAADFASRYMRHVLGFLGITDVEVLGADQLARDAAGALDRAQRQIDAAVAAFRDPRSHDTHSPGGTPS